MMKFSRKRISTYMYILFTLTKNLQKLFNINKQKQFEIVHNYVYYGKDKYFKQHTCHQQNFLYHETTIKHSYRRHTIVLV